MKKKKQKKFKKKNEAFGKENKVILNLIKNNDRQDD